MILSDNELDNLFRSYDFGLDHAAKVWQIEELEQDEWQFSITE